MERYAEINGEKILLKKGELQRKSDGMLMFRYLGDSGDRKTLYATDIDDLRKKERLLIGFTVKVTYTIDELYNEWKITKTGIRQHTMQNYAWLYNAYVKSKFGKRKVVEVTFGDIVRFYISLKNERYLSVTTIDGLHTVLQQVFLYGVRQGYIVINPCSGAMTDLKRATAKSEIKTFSKREQSEFLGFCKEYHEIWYALFATMLFSGMRCGEVCGLQWSDIDFDNNRIDIRHNLVYYRKDREMLFEMSEPKTKAGVRSFFMSSTLREVLLMQRNSQKKSKVCINGYEDFVFVTKVGTTYQQGTINKALRRIIADYNVRAMENEKPLLPSLSSHGLRKSFCCRMAEARVPLKVAAEIMGHSDSRTTFDIYMTVSNDWKAKELRNFDEYMKKVQ